MYYCRAVTWNKMYKYSVEYFADQWSIVCIFTHAIAQ